SWLPQIGVDANNRPWVVWSQQLNNNWDLYARYYDTVKQEWGPVERLTRESLPDINPRLTSDGKGKMALVWQGFRGKNSNIFLKTFDGQKWSADVRVTNRAANDWEPAVALDPQGAAWVAYDSYKNGNYDVFISKVTNGVAGAETAIAKTPKMEARPTLAVDTGGRLWIAWEEGEPNWGKDNGYWFRKTGVGVPLGNERQVRVRCLVGNEWKEPAAIADGMPANAYHPEIFSDGHGSVWVAAIRIVTGGGGDGGRGKKKKGAGAVAAHFEYWVSHLDGNAWSKGWALPHAKGRSSTRMNSALAKDGKLWIVWPTDNRSLDYAHRPLRQQVYAGVL